jgi:pimeloyl-ACP methyl ester carboxylesterase
MASVLGERYSLAMIGVVVLPASSQHYGRSGLRGSSRSPGTTFRISRLRCSLLRPTPNTAIVIHSYRHRYRAAQGDPALEHIEPQLARQPVITVPTIVLHGESDGVSPPQSSERHDRFFTGLYQRRVVPIAGHFLPREAPEAVVQAVRELGSQP